MGTPLLKTSVHLAAQIFPAVKNRLAVKKKDLSAAAPKEEIRPLKISARLAAQRFQKETNRLAISKKGLPAVPPKGAIRPLKISARLAAQRFKKETSRMEISRKDLSAAPPKGAIPGLKTSARPAAQIFPNRKNRQATNGIFLAKESSAKNSSATKPFLKTRATKTRSLPKGQTDLLALLVLTGLLPAKAPPIPCPKSRCA